MQFKSGSGEGGQGKAFVKLSDKEKVKGVFRGEVCEFRTHWGATTSTLCPGDSCEICAKGGKENRPGFRFRLNLIVKDKESGQYVAKIFEGGWKIYQILKNLHESGYNLEQTVVEITRYGSGKNDTSYQVLPDPKAKFEGQLAQAIAAVELLSLDPAAPAEERAPVDASASDANEDLPF